MDGDMAGDMAGDMEGMDGQMDGDMAGDDMNGDMAGDMEGMDGDMDGDMDGMDEMDGDADAPVVDMEGNPVEEEKVEEPAADSGDFTKDPRIQWMLQNVEKITNYSADEEAMAPTNERLS